ncbi:MAG: IS481 family transposase [Propionibacteriales bacterium]|nr:IS481 family transposase [Propionibacteriales bacterium]
MVHANAALTPRARLRLARLIVEDGWRPAEAAKMFMVSTITARKWANRFRTEAPAGMSDRSRRPRSCPHRTSEQVKRWIVALRWRQRLGPVQIGGRLGVAPSTVHAVLVRCRMNRLSHVDRATGEPIRRYEHPHPGLKIHVDVARFGNIPDGGGWRYVGKAQGDRNRAATVQRTGAMRSRTRDPLLGTAFLHTVIDDHSRVAYVEVCADEKAVTAIGVLRRAVAWFAERVLSDNGNCYRSHAWAHACADLAITPKRTRPYRVQANGKIERIHRTLADGWAYARFYGSETERRAALPVWIHFFNHHRRH